MVLLLGACAGADVRPIVDMKGVNEARYENDLAECQNYAKGAGAVIGGAGGAYKGNESQEAIVKKCLVGRGYKVLN
jgi:outer membrane lipoprotein SlyB